MEDIGASGAVLKRGWFLCEEFRNKDNINSRNYVGLKINLCVL
jgi:hypothetical protein